MKEDKRYTKGHFIGIGIAIGLPIGIPIGLALGNIALGPALGLPIGLSIGIAMEKIHNKNPIPLTQEEKTKQNRWSWIGISVGLFLAIILAIIYFQAK